MAEEEYGCMRMVTLLKFILTDFFLWELGYLAQVMSGSLSLRDELGAIILWYCVCGPFAARGAQGKVEYP